MKTVENLQLNETLLVGIRKNAGGKFGIDLAEIVKSSSTNEHNELISLLNKSDERFSQGGKPRRLVISAEADQIKQYFGIDVNELAFKTVQKVSGEGTMVYAQINLLNPEINGKRIRLVVKESTTPFDDYQIKNPDKTCKKTPKGEMLLVDGQQIFSTIEMTLGEPKHIFVQHDQVVKVVTPMTTQTAGGVLV